MSPDYGSSYDPILVDRAYAEIVSSIFDKCNRPQFLMYYRCNPRLWWDPSPDYYD